MPRLHLALLALLATTLAAPAQTAPADQYFRTGNPSNIAARPHAGFALMGGGEDLDEAFGYLCAHARGGDLVVLRATGDDAYNPYIQKLCHLNSVSTLIVPSRAAASDPFAARIIAQASAIFIAGGDQANYISFWQGTPIQAELNSAIARGIPLGGTSAGLAVLGEWVYSAQGDKPGDPNLDARTALANPSGPRITLVNGFLAIPVLKGVITDSHFAKRNRMGRLLVFLARLNQPDSKPASPSAPSIRGIGIDERSALLVDTDGTAKVVGPGAGVWFVDAAHAAGTLKKGRPLTFGRFDAQKVASGQTFNLTNWTGEGAWYQLSVDAGTIHSTQLGDTAY
jgi:cyanophycinase